MSDPTEKDLVTATELMGRPPPGEPLTNLAWTQRRNAIAQALASARSDERERCAKIADSYALSDVAAQQAQQAQRAPESQLSAMNRPLTVGGEIAARIRRPPRSSP